MSAAPVEELEVDDLDPAGVLAAAVEAERAEREAAVRKLRLAYQWAVLHPATEDSRVLACTGRLPSRVLSDSLLPWTSA